jgi:DNA-binding transcriptional ArsR family regulator
LTLKGEAAVPTSASRDFIDSEMAKALTHPLRIDILGEFSRRGGGLMSASDYAHRHDLEVSFVSHHFRALEKRGLIEEVKRQTVRGAVEYLYRLKRKYIFEGDEWDRLPLPVRLGVSGRTLRNLFEAIAEAVDGETFEERPTERALAWDKNVFDEEGWRKVAVYFRKGIDVAMEASEESEERLAESGEKGISATWSLLFFQAPE